MTRVASAVGLSVETGPIMSPGSCRGLLREGTVGERKPRHLPMTGLQ